MRGRETEREGEREEDKRVIARRVGLVTTSKHANPLPCGSGSVVLM